MRHAVAVPIPLLAIGLFAGCGIGSTTATKEHSSTASRAGEPARTILDEAATALTHAHSFALRGHLDIAKRQTRVELEAQEPNTARLTLERGTSVVAVVFFGDGNGAYLRANRAFFLAEYAHEPVPAAVVKLLANRWLKVPAKEAGGQPKLDARSLGGASLPNVARSSLTG
jgi:hypothetical protein